MTVFYFKPHGPKTVFYQYKGSFNRKKIECMSKRGADGSVYECELPDFKGHLMSGEWHG